MTNFPNGVTNAASTSAMGTLTQLDPTKVHTYFNDFNLFNASDWDILGGGVNTQSIADEAKGILEIKNGNISTDNSYLQLKNQTFKIVRGKKCHFKASFRFSGTQASLNLGAFIIGIQILSPISSDVSDGIFFLNSLSVDDPTAADNLEFHIRKDAVNSVATVATGLLITDEYEVAFVYDGKSEVQYYFNDIKIGALDVINLPDDEELAVSFDIQNGENATRTMHIDYIYVANER